MSGLAALNLHIHQNMPLPDSQHFSRKAGSKSPSTNQHPQRKTYAQTVVASTKVSLIHEPLKTTSNSTGTTVTIMQSRIYRAGRIPGALLFDMSHVGDKYTDFQCLEKIHEQHPGVYGATIIKEGAQRYVETYILESDDSNNISKEGVNFADENIKILPNLAIQDKTQIVRLKLSNLPMFHPKVVKAGLTESLKVFGEILDVGIFLEPKLGLFMGTGYAVLNVAPAVDKKYVELSHQINWCESEEEIFHAVWSNMPTWCRYCHKEGHTKFDCVQAKAKIICYSCHHQGHRSFECPRRNYSTPANKKLDRKTYQAKEKVIPSEAIMDQEKTQTDEAPKNKAALDTIEDDNSEGEYQSSTDGMDTDSSEGSVANEAEQRFRDQVILCTDELKECEDFEQLHQTVVEMQQKNEILKCVASESAKDSGEWKVLQRTPEAVAIVKWLNQQKYKTLMESPKTRAENSSAIDSLNIHFQAAQHAHWTPHVGIVSFSPLYDITIVNTSQHYESDRFQLCKVEHPQHSYEPFYILNIYAPASSDQERRTFFDQMAGLLYNVQDQVPWDRLIISGDFNYSLLRKDKLNYSTSSEWLSLLDIFFSNSMTVNELTEVPTFQRSRGTGNMVSSVIDYIFLGLQLSAGLKTADISKLQSKWSDHSMLHISFTVGKTVTGPGLWRANPIYSNHKKLQGQITSKVEQLMKSFDNNTTITDALKWDRIKQQIKKVIRSYSYQYVDWRKTKITKLEKQRNKFLRTKPDSELKSLILPAIDKQLDQLQQELTEISGLRAGIKWREQGETSAGFLKKLHHQRSLQQHMSAFKTNDADNNESRTSEPAGMQEVVRDFYQKLYTSDPVSITAINEYLADINLTNTVNEDENEMLITDITLDEILDQVKRSPKRSSPGEDGLGYQYLNFIYRIPILQPLIVKVYNQALQHGITPPSWKELRVRLLPKKNDLTDLKNWRPISLINCDAKVLSRIINSRISDVANNIICSSQTGFLSGRFIGDNGLAVHLLVQQANYLDYDGVGLLLDQEKAYDRVNPYYLEQVLLRFGFHQSFVKCIVNLFFGNAVQVNVNGFFAPTVFQERGLRQGDPLSPLLFNLAMEPLLLHINQDQQLKGYEFPHQETIHRIKTIAYADDICAILKNQDEYRRLKQQLERYALVSNARFNREKTKAFSLNGRLDLEWKAVLAADQIDTYYTKYSREAFEYLGFFIAYTANQRNQAQEALLRKVKASVCIYSTRQLSLRGRATIANTLIMSKLWYCLRLLNPTKAWFHKVQTVLYKFVWLDKNPKVSFTQLSLPIEKGGLGLLKPSVQHLTLQIRHLNHLFGRSTSEPVQHVPVKLLLDYHMSIISSANSFPLISFFIPELRNHTLTNHTSILNAMYNSFDHFDFQVDIGRLGLPTLLSLPLRYMFNHIPTDHWLQRHKMFPTQDFFIFDEHVKRLRIRVESEYIQKPQLCKQLVKHLLTDRTVTLLPRLWDFILDDVRDNSLASVDNRIIEDFKNQPLWIKFESKVYRQYSKQPTPSALYPVSKARYKLFWSSTMLLNARTVWFKAFTNKIPTAIFLKKIKKLDSSNCRLCQQSRETLAHFLVFCPTKLDIWSSIIPSYFGHINLTIDDIYYTLRLLKIPKVVPTYAEKIKFVVTLSTIQYFIWRDYWQYIIEQVPFPATTTMVSNIIKQLDILFNTNSIA